MPQLLLPEISQWGTGANHRIRDCLVACIAMVLVFYGKLGKLTVDDLVKETPEATSDSGLWPQSAIPVLKKRGIGSVVVRNTTLELIRTAIDNGKPVIALISYRFITGRLDQGDNNPLTDGHFIVLEGYTDEYFIANDPDYWAPFVERGHYTHLPIAQLEKALQPFGSSCVFITEVSLLDQIISLAQQIEAAAQQLKIQPPITPTPGPSPVAVVTNPGTHIRLAASTSAMIADTVSGIDLNVIDTGITVDNHKWYKIIDGKYVNDYVAQDVVSPKV